MYRNHILQEFAPGALGELKEAP